MSEDIGRLIEEAGFRLGRVVEEVCKRVGEYGVYATVRLKDLFYSDEERKLISKIFRRFGCKVAYYNYLYIESDEQVEKMLSTLIDLGYIENIDGDIVYWSDKRDGFKLENPTWLLKALYRYPSVMEKLGITRAHIIEKTLESAGLSTKKLLEAGFKEEKVSDWLLHFKLKEGEFQHRVSVEPGWLEAITSRTYIFPLIGEHTITERIYVEEGETLREALNRNMTSIEKRAASIRKTAEALSKAAEELGVKIVKAEIYMDSLQFEWKYKNLPKQSYSVAIGYDGDVESFKEEVKKFTAVRELSGEEKFMVLRALVSLYTVDVKELVNATGAGYRSIVKYAKSLGAQYERGYLTLPEEKKVEAVEKALDSGLITPKQAATLLTGWDFKAFSQKVYDALRKEDRKEAALYKISTVSFEEALEEAEALIGEGRRYTAVSALLAIKNRFSIYGDYAEEFGKVTAKIIESMERKEFEIEANSIKKLLEGPAREVYGQKLGKYVGLGRPDRVEGGRAVWEKDKVIVYVEPTEEGWLYGFASKQRPHAVNHERTFRGIIPVNTEWLEHEKKIVEYGERIAEQREKMYVEAIYSALKKYSEIVGEEPDVETERDDLGRLVIKIPNVGTYVIGARAFRGSDGEAVFKASEWTLPTFFDCPADVADHIKKKLSLDFYEELEKRRREYVNA